MATSIPWEINSVCPKTTTDTVEKRDNFAPAGNPSLLGREAEKAALVTNLSDRLKQYRECTYNVTKARSRNHCCRGKAINIKYCVF